MREARPQTHSNKDQQKYHQRQRRPYGHPLARRRHKIQQPLAETRHLPIHPSNPILVRPIVTPKIAWAASVTAMKTPVTRIPNVAGYGVTNIAISSPTAKTIATHHSRRHWPFTIAAYITPNVMPLLK